MRQTLLSINRVFARNGDVAVAVAKHPHTGRLVLLVTDTYVKVPIVPAKGVSYQTIMRLLPELEDAVGRIYEKKIKLRFGMNPFCIEIPRFNPQYTELSFDTPVVPFECRIGKTFQYNKAHDVRINLNDSNSAHVLIAGMVGCGKSNVLEALLLSMTYATNPKDLSIYMIDMKKRSLVRYDKLPHVVVCASTEVEAEQVCSSVFHEMIRRRDHNENNNEKIVLIVDELRELKFADSSILDNYLPRIVAIGRELGVHVIAATQKPSASDLGPIINALFPIRIVGVVEDAQASYRLLKRKGAGAESLIGRGDMLISQSGQDPARMQAYLVKNPNELVERICEKWGDAPERAVTPVASPVPHVGNEQIPEQAVRVYWENYDAEKDKLRHGGLRKVAEALYGEGTTVQGHIHRDVTRICTKIKNETKPL